MLRIHNRSLPGDSAQFALPGDGWYQLEVAGDHRNGDVVQIVDERAVRAIVANYHDQGDRDPNFPGLLVDVDHFSLDANKSTEAEGWVTDMRVGADHRGDPVPEGRIRWSDKGLRDVRGGKFRFFSTVYNRSEMEDLGGGRLRPTRIDRIAVTNDPNNKGGRPITNRQEADDKNQPNNEMKLVLSTLALAATATEADAVEAIKNRAEEFDSLKSDHDALLKDVVAGDLKVYANRIAKGDEDKWEKRLLANRADTIDILEGMSAPKGEATGRIHNRAEASTPGDSAATDGDLDTPERRETAAKIVNRANQLTAERGIPYGTAFGLAKSEFGG